MSKIYLDNFSVYEDFKFRIWTNRVGFHIEILLIVQPSTWSQVLGDNSLPGRSLFTIDLLLHCHLCIIDKIESFIDNWMNCSNCNHENFVNNSC
jgi:predicted AlkP superfamily pyrophosphatase or phosphodiesterase